MLFRPLGTLFAIAAIMWAPLAMCLEVASQVQASETASSELCDTLASHLTDSAPAPHSSIPFPDLNSEEESEGSSADDLSELAACTDWLLVATADCNCWVPQAASLRITNPRFGTHATRAPPAC